MGTPLLWRPADPGSNPVWTEPAARDPCSLFRTVLPSVSGEVGSDRVRDGAGDSESTNSPASSPPLEPDLRENQLPTPVPNDDAADRTL